MTRRVGVGDDPGFFGTEGDVGVTLVRGVVDGESDGVGDDVGPPLDVLPPPLLMALAISGPGNG